MNASAADEFPRLIFDWGLRRQPRLTLLGFIAASLLGHVFCFYLFQIVYPSTVGILPPPARVSLISPDSEEGRNVLHWIEAQDPALAFVTQRPSDSRLRALPNVEHIPSYFANEPAIQQLPPLTMEFHTPSAQPPGPVPIVHPRPAPARGEVPTAISFSKELAELGVTIRQQTKFTATTREPPQALEFRVAVNIRGEIQYCFMMNSSGDPVLDQQARQHLVLCRFTPAQWTTAKPDPASLTWGVATIEWGTDIERPQEKAGMATSAQ